MRMPLSPVTGGAIRTSKVERHIVLIVTVMIENGECVSTGFVMADGNRFISDYSPQAWFGAEKHDEIDVRQDYRVYSCRT